MAKFLSMAKFLNYWMLIQLIINASKPLLHITPGQKDCSQLSIFKAYIYCSMFALDEHAATLETFSLFLAWLYRHLFEWSNCFDQLVLTSLRCFSSRSIIASVICIHIYGHLSGSISLRLECCFNREVREWRYNSEKLRQTKRNGGRIWRSFSFSFSQNTLTLLDSPGVSIICFLFLDFTRLIIVQTLYFRQEPYRILLNEGEQRIFLICSRNRFMWGMVSELGFRRRASYTHDFNLAVFVEQSTVHSLHSSYSTVLLIYASAVHKMCLYTNVYFKK